MHLPSPFARWSAGLILGLSALGASAQTGYTAGLVDFQTLAPNAIGQHLPEGYAGFDWAAKYYYMANAAGNVYIAMDSNTSSYIRRWDGAPFYFDGADFWSRRGLDATGDFYFVAYYKGQTVYNGRTDKKGGRMRFTGTPTWLKPNYTGLVDQVALTFDGNKKDWNHLAFDRLRFRALSAP